MKTPSQMFRQPLNTPLLRFNIYLLFKNLKLQQGNVISLKTQLFPSYVREASSGHLSMKRKKKFSKRECQLFISSSLVLYILPLVLFIYLILEQCQLTL